MRDPPPDVVASWPSPNYVNPEYQGPQLAIVGIVLLVLSTAVLCLRLWVRVRMKKTAGWDDWLMVVAMVCCYSGCPFSVVLLRSHGMRGLTFVDKILNIGSTVCSIIGTHYGWGTLFDLSFHLLPPPL